MTYASPTPLQGTPLQSLSRLPTHDATELTLGGNQALITLNDQVYNLRITRAGKLILTK